MKVVNDDGSHVLDLRIWGDESGYRTVRKEKIAKLIDEIIHENDWMWEEVRKLKKE